MDYILLIVVLNIYHTRSKSWLSEADPARYGVSITPSPRWELRVLAFTAKRAEDLNSKHEESCGSQLRAWREESCEPQLAGQFPALYSEIQGQGILSKPSSNRSLVHCSPKIKRTVQHNPSDSLDDKFLCDEWDLYPQPFYACPLCVPKHGFWSTANTIWSLNHSVTEIRAASARCQSLWWQFPRSCRRLQNHIPHLCLLNIMCSSKHERNCDSRLLGHFSAHHSEIQHEDFFFTSCITVLWLLGIVSDCLAHLYWQSWGLDTGIVLPHSRWRLVAHHTSGSFRLHPSVLLRATARLSRVDPLWSLVHSVAIQRTASPSYRSSRCQSRRSCRLLQKYTPHLYLLNIVCSFKHKVNCKSQLRPHRELRVPAIDPYDDNFQGRVGLYKNIHLTCACWTSYTASTTKRTASLSFYHGKSSARSAKRAASPDLSGHP